MYKLTRIYYENCKIVSLHDEINAKDELLKHLLDNDMIMIAYDCDFNFEPCFKNGTKAHWSLVSGYLSFINDTDNQLEQLCDSSSCTISNYNSNNMIVELMQHKSHKNEKLLRLLNKNEFYTFNLHGKSKHYGVWDFNKLLASNRQLSTVDVKRDNQEYVIPDASISTTLANKALIIY